MEKEEKDTFLETRWFIPVYYKMWGIVPVSKSKYPLLKEACLSVRDMDFPLPSDPWYVEDSIVVDDDAVEILNQQDETKE